VKITAFRDAAQTNIDKLIKSPKFRHACEGRHPELFENTGFPAFAGMTPKDVLRLFTKPSIFQNTTIPSFQAAYQENGRKTHCNSYKF
jgi:hypothetical protein